MKKLLIATMLLISTPALANTCKIVGISDGDTATCLTSSKNQIKIRFDQIDAPEKKQAFGTQAHQTLANMIFGKQVTLRIKTTDRYGRTVAEVFVGHTNINKAMVEQGMAWAYREYMTDTDYLRLEGIAKSAKRGLWSHPNPIYPQDFRRGGSSGTTKTKVNISNQISNSGGSSSTDKTKVSTSSQSIKQSKSGGGSCSGIKRTCGAMSSCAEARRALQCGVSSLDRDKDGIPCEKLCR